MTTVPGLRRPMITRAMQAPDDIVAVITYRDNWGRMSRRVVSPIRWLDPGRFLAFCLERQANRTFYIGRCVDIKIAIAAEAMAGVKLEA